MSRLIRAVSHGKLKKVEELISRNQNSVNSGNLRGQTALIDNDCLQILRDIIQSMKKKKLDALINRLINKVDNDNTTALWLAIEYNNYNIANELHVRKWWLWYK